MRKISNKVAQQQLTAAERPSLNQESLQPLQAHYQQYLQQQQQSMKYSGSYSASNMSNHQLQSSADLSLSQSATSDANQTYKMIDSQRSSRVQTQKSQYTNAQSNSGTVRNDSQQYQHSNAISNSASSKGTPSFQQNQKARRGEVVAVNFGGTGFNGNASGPINNLPSTTKSGSNYYQSKSGLQHNGKGKGKKTTVKENLNSKKGKISGAPLCEEFKISGCDLRDQKKGGQEDYKNFFQNTNQFSNLLQNGEDEEDNASCQFVISDGGLTLYQAKSMQGHHKKNNPSNMGASQNPSTVNKNENSQSNYNINKHLRFDSIQDSSSATNQQFLSLTSNHYQNLISGTSEDNDQEQEQAFCRDSLYDQENIQHHNMQSIPTDLNYQRLSSGGYQQVARQFENEKMRQLREMMSDTPDLPQSTRKNQITLSNSLLECVDQYGNIEDQYSVLLESQGDYNEDLRNESSTKKQFISELNNPNSYLNTVSKDVRALGSIYQDGENSNTQNKHYYNQQPLHQISNYNDFQNQNQNFLKQQQADYNNIYNVEHLANLASNQNFVVCSPSANTDDDCQYTNSSALRSMDDRTASGFKNQPSSNENKRSAQLIYTDDRKDELSQGDANVSGLATIYGRGKTRERESDLSLLNQQMRKFQSSENQSQNQNLQHDQKQYFSSSGKEQFTGDNGDSCDEDQEDEDEEIESKLTLMFKTKDDRQMQRTSSSFINESCDKRTLTGGFNQNPREEKKFQYITQTPNHQMQNDLYLQVLDSDSRDQIVNDTPQVMEMIDQSNFNLHSRRETMNAGSGNQLVGSQNSVNQKSPMILGSKENKKINQTQKQEEERGARHLNFKDISPLVKSSNTFTIENGILVNEHSIGQNPIGKLSQPQIQGDFSQTHSQQNADAKFILGNQLNAVTNDSISTNTFQLNQQQQQQQFSNTLTNYATELGSTLNNPNSLSYYNRQHPTHFHPFDFLEQERQAGINSHLSPEQLLTKEQMMMTNKLSSQMVESPPPLNDLTPEKGIKDFNRQYLGSGMWPHKPVQASLQGAIKEYSLMNSGIGDASLLSSRSNNNVATKMGEQLKRIENQMSSISKKMGAQHQQDRSSRDISDSKQYGQVSQSHGSFEFQNERARQQQNQRNHPLALSGQYQNGVFNTQQQNYYPGVDANIVQKISSTLDHMNNRFHFKRQSEQVPTMTNHFIRLKGPKEKIDAPNTMVNNTVFNQSSLDDICNTNYAGGANFDDISSNNQTNLQQTNELYYNNSQFNSIRNHPQQHIYQQQNQRQIQTNSNNSQQVLDGQQLQHSTSLQNKYGLPQSNFTTNNKNTVNNSTISANNRSPITTSSGPRHGVQTHTPISRNGQQQQQNMINIAQNSATSNICRQSNNNARLSNVSDMNPVNNSTSSNTHNNSVINSNANTNPNSNYNTSSFVKQVTLNGFGLGTVNQRMNDTSATTNSMRITNPTYQTNNGMGMGTLGTLGANGCSVGESQNFNTFENVIKNGEQNFQLQSLNNHPLLGNFSQTLQQIMDTNQSIQQQLPAYPHQGPEQDGHRRIVNQDGEECCQDCLFEREKRMVTQKAFERALGISLFLMEEIDKINLIETHNQKAQDRPSTLTQSTGANKNPQLHFSRQDLTNILLDQTQYSQTFTNIPHHQNQYPNLNQTYTIPHNRNLSSSPVSDNLLTASGGAYHPLNTSNLPMSVNRNIQQQKSQQMQLHQQSQTRLGRSKSQSLMPGEFQAMQKSLQLPRGIGLLHAVNQISGGNPSHQRQIGQQPRLRVVEEERDERTGEGNRIFFDNLKHNQQQNMTAYI